MRVQEFPLKDIKVSGRFREDMGDLDALAETIKEKGVLQPITVDEKFRLLSGHRRLEASRLAGLKTIPTIVRKTNGSELDALEVELIENVARKDFTWSERAKLEKRVFEIKAKADPKWSTRKQGEFTEQSHATINRRLQLAEALDILPELADSQNEDEAWKKLSRIKEDAVISMLKDKAGGKFAKASEFAGDHYIIGDVFKGLEKVHDHVVHFVEIDPPYGVDIDVRKSRSEGKQLLDNYTEIAAKEYPAFIAELASEAYRVMSDNSFGVWWFGMSWYQDVLATLREAGFKVSDIPAIWNKDFQGQTASPDTMLGSAYEPFFILRKGMPKMARPGRANVFTYRQVPPSKKIHATEKPIDLMVDILETFTYPGALCCIPFLGSGVTLRACYKLNRGGYGWEIDKRLKDRFLSKVAEEILEPKGEGKEE
jgi:ParB/RepB/Spo0J family partition protein